jgi:hypothetical protein
MPKIRVIIPHLNTMLFLGTCLTALRRPTFRDFETILVDKGSEEGLVEYVLGRFPEVRLVALRARMRLCHRVSSRVEGERPSKSEPKETLDCRS